MIMVDLHCHLLDGLDGSPERFEEMERMLFQAAEQGIRHIAAMPHMAPEVQKLSRKLYQKKLTAVQVWVEAKSLPLNIWSGAAALP